MGPVTPHTHYSDGEIARNHKTHGCDNPMRRDGSLQKTPDQPTNGVGERGNGKERVGVVVTERTES